MYRGGDDESEEPSWVSSEREQFTEFRDKNQDGFMDEEEVSQEEPNLMVFVDKN